MKRRIVVFGGSFNPPGIHHKKIALELKKFFDLVIIFPCGYRPDKKSANILSLNDRKELVIRGFNNIPKGIILNLFDLDNQVYTPTFLLQEMLEKEYKEDEIWHAVGGDIIAGGKEKKSDIFTWDEGEKIWQDLNYAVLTRPGYNMQMEDMPPHSELYTIKNLIGSGTLIREYIKKNMPIEELVEKEVLEYIIANKLFL